jgi:hypothetical protein
MGIKLFFFVSILSTSLMSYATCTSSCRDTDAGRDPEYAGVVIVKTKCSPPGGPINQTEQYFLDSCSDNELTEYVCEGYSGVEFAKKVIVECKKCSPIREGVCLDFAK